MATTVQKKAVTVLDRCEVAEPGRERLLKKARAVSLKLCQYCERMGTRFQFNGQPLYACASDEAIKGWGEEIAYDSGQVMGRERTNQNKAYSTHSRRWSQSSRARRTSVTRSR